MYDTCKLTLHFDPLPLQLDLQKIHREEWVRHFNADYYSGDWEGLALRSVGGLTNRIYPDPNAQGDVLDTEVLTHCPNIAAAISSFHCEVRSARLLRLSTGSRIREHRDYNLAYEDGEVRLHVPITTNDAVEFCLNGARVEMKEGECWYLNFNLPHKVANNGLTDRVHLVLDCLLNDWLRELFAKGEKGVPEHQEFSRPNKITGGWEEFYQYVLENQDVQEQLRRTEDRRVFVDLVIAEAHRYGFHVTLDDVEQAIRNARRNWIERWID